MILPQAFLVAFSFGGVIYEWPEYSRNYESFIFFQGNIDMGGACLFAGSIMLYLVFGFTASWYLTLKLNKITHQSFLQSIKNSIVVLKYHILAFAIGGTMNIPYDARAGSNDFRNMFLFVFVLYCLNILFICLLQKFKLKTKLQFFLSPLFIIIWLYLGSDGNTERAGQLVSDDKKYEYKVRGKRHSIMVSWHKLCDSLLGDVKLNI